MTVSVIIPAKDEASVINGCLQALVCQHPTKSYVVEIIVAVNGSRDETAKIARSFEEPFKIKGWILKVIEIKTAGKTSAINAAEKVASGNARMFLDADVVCSPDLISETEKALRSKSAVFASGKLIVAPAKTWTTKHVAAFWSQLSFVTEGVPGAGFYAVNEAGRKRWSNFPMIISDDTFVRQHFTREERVRVSSTYTWPLPEGFVRLVRVRRRQERGLQQIRRKFRDLPKPERNSFFDYFRLMRDMPTSFAVYALVVLLARAGTLFPRTRNWASSRAIMR